jgi:hypothetical protein
MKFVTLYFSIVYELAVMHVVIMSTYTVWTILNSLPCLPACSHVTTEKPYAYFMKLHPE